MPWYLQLGLAVLALTSEYLLALWRHRSLLKHELWKRRLEHYGDLLENQWYFTARRISINVLIRVVEGISEDTVHKDYVEALNQLIRANLKEIRGRLLISDELLRKYNRSMEQSISPVLNMQENETVEDVLLAGVDRGVIQSVDEVTRMMREDLRIGKLGACDTPR